MIRSEGRIKLISCLLFFASFTVFMQAIAAYGAVGQSLSQMTREIGTPAKVSLYRMIASTDVPAYQHAGVTSYAFKAGRFKLYALFNKSGYCYKISTFNNVLLPPLELLIGTISKTEKPVLLSRESMMSAIYQYGSGKNAIFYKTFGTPGNVRATAYMPSLAP